MSLRLLIKSVLLLQQISINFSIGDAYGFLIHTIFFQFFFKGFHCFRTGIETDMFSDSRKGIFAFISNRDEEAKKIYLAYKERGDIEQCFDYLKNSVDIGASSKGATNPCWDGHL